MTEVLLPLGGSGFWPNNSWVTAHPEVIWCPARIYQSVASTRSHSSLMAWIVCRAERESRDDENWRNSAPFSPGRAETERDVTKRSTCSCLLSEIRLRVASALYRIQRTNPTGFAAKCQARQVGLDLAPLVPIESRSHYSSTFSPALSSGIQTTSLRIHRPRRQFS